MGKFRLDIKSYCFKRTVSVGQADLASAQSPFRSTDNPQNQTPKHPAYSSVTTHPFKNISPSDPRRSLSSSNAPVEPSVRSSSTYSFLQPGDIYSETALQKRLVSEWKRLRSVPDLDGFLKFLDQNLIFRDGANRVICRTNGHLSVGQFFQDWASRSFKLNRVMRLFGGFRRPQQPSLDAFDSMKLEPYVIKLVTSQAHVVARSELAPEVELGLGDPQAIGPFLRNMSRNLATYFRWFQSNLMLSDTDWDAISLILRTTQTLDSYWQSMSPCRRQLTTFLQQTQQENLLRLNELLEFSGKLQSKGASLEDLVRFVDPIIPIKSGVNCHELMSVYIDELAYDFVGNNPKVPPKNIPIELM